MSETQTLAAKQEQEQTHGYLDTPDANAEDFDYRAHLSSYPQRLLSSPAGRRAITRLDPLAFACIYLSRHLKDDATDNRITFSDLHLELYRSALRYAAPAPPPRSSRIAYIAPRNSGKSSTAFLAIPLWAAAHGHIQFIAAFSDTADQAALHLSTFRRELDENPLLRSDYPELCTPMRHARSNLTQADKANMFMSKSNFTFSARGIDSNNLGMKVGNLRPQLILLDDVERGEENYSAYQAEQRLSTIKNVVFPMNDRAHVVLIGTVTMPNSIIHQLVKSLSPANAHDKALRWVTEENITVRHFKAITTRSDGSERSMWPGRWPFHELDAIRHTASYRLNFDNDPAGRDGDYWSPDDFSYEHPTAITRKVLSIDPAVTTARTSDPTALATISLSPGRNPTERRVCVERVAEVRLNGEQLRDLVLDWIEDDPDITSILIETNQGGSLWETTLHDMPVPLHTIHQREKKEIRAAWAHSWYTRKRVTHATRHPALEEQMVAFPKAQHDDLVDAVATGILHFMGKPVRPPRKRRIIETIG